MTRSMSVGETVHVVTLTRDAAARTWTVRWQQLGKSRELVARGSISDVMSAARVAALKIESQEGEEACPETERNT